MPIIPTAPTPQQNRTEVGIRSLHQSSQPAASKKAGRRAPRARTKHGGNAHALDSVSREETTLLVDEVGEEPRRQRRNDGTSFELESGSGHASTMARWPGRAFRLDESGHTIPPHFSDVEQGELQDAWLLACFAAVAHARPEALTRRVNARRDGEFVLRLGSRKHRVTSDFPTEGYAEPEPRNHADTLWVALFEKAFALEAGCSYASLEAGNPARALPLLVPGRSLRQRVRTRGEASPLVDALRDHALANRPIVGITRTRDVRAPFIADHAYAIVRVSTDGIITAYNPWGTRRGSRELQSVLHEVPWEEARTAFEFLYVGGIDEGE